MERIKNKFKAVDQHGNIYNVIDYAFQIAESHLSSTTGKTYSDGISRFALDDGKTLSGVKGEPGAFNILHSDKIIRQIP